MMPRGHGRRFWAVAGSVLALGVALVLFARTGRSQAPPARYEVQPDTVRDVKTHLTWQRGISGQQLSFAAAGQYCGDLILGGRDDWRTPSLQEFQTIVDEARVRPAIDPAIFSGTPPEGFWSATPWAETPQLAWHVDFATGSAAYERATVVYWARCVRWDP